MLHWRRLAWVLLSPSPPSSFPSPPFSFLPLAQCPKPVIAAIHSACMGAGMDLVTACDIRLCSSDTWFQIKVTGGRGRGVDKGAVRQEFVPTDHKSLFSWYLYNCHSTSPHASCELLLFSIGSGNRVGCRHWHSAASAEGGGKCQSGTRAGLHCQEILS